MVINNGLFAKTYWPVATRFASLCRAAQKHGTSIGKSEILTCQITCQRSITSIQREFSNIFRPFHYKLCTRDSSKLLNLNRNCELYKNFSRSFIFGRNSQSPKRRKRRIPKLILLQNPFSWLVNKIDFRVLRYVWDPDFKEKEFKFGTKQAISRVTQVISDGQYSELNGLLTKAARASLLRELDRNWGIKQRSLLALNQEDIQISSPRKVYFIRIGGMPHTLGRAEGIQMTDVETARLVYCSYFHCIFCYGMLLRGSASNKNKIFILQKRAVCYIYNLRYSRDSPRDVFKDADKKFCDVDMAFLALKWTPINNIDALLFTEIFARFHREYTPYCIPEWTIAYFKVTRFEVLRR